MEGRKRDIVVLSDDEESPLKETNSTFTRHQQTQGKGLDSRSPTKPNRFTQPEQFAKSFFKDPARSERIQKSRGESGSADDDGDGGWRVLVGTNQNRDVLAADVPKAPVEVKSDQNYFPPSHDHDHNHDQPSLYTTSGSIETGHPRIVFAKPKHSHRQYRHRPSEQEDADSANKMLPLNILDNKKTSPPPSAGLLVAQTSASDSPPPSRQSAGQFLLPSAAVIEDEPEVHGKIVEAKRAPRLQIKQHSSEVISLDDEAPVELPVEGGSETGQKIHTLARSKDGLGESYKKDETISKRQPKDLKGYHSKTIQLQRGQSGNMPRGFGAFKPITSYATRDKPIVTAAPKTKPTSGKHLDLAPASPPSAADEPQAKRQKLTHNGAEREASDVGPNDAENDEARGQTTAPSCLSYSPTGQRKHDNGRLEEYVGMDKLVRPRNRKPRSSGAHQFKKQHSFELTQTNGEVCDDPIYDELSNPEAKKPGTTPQVLLPAKQTSPPQIVYQSNTRASRPSGPTTKSRYFQNSGTRQNENSMDRQKGRTVSSTGVSDDDVDPLSKDHYATGITEKRAPVDKLNNVEEVSSEDEKPMKGHIPPSLPRSTRRQLKQGERSFTVTKAFSESRKWLVEDSDAQWLLLYNQTDKTLILYNIQKKAMWTLNCGKLQKIEQNPESNQMILHKSADVKDNIGTRVHLQFQNAEQSESLRVLLKTAHSTIGCPSAETEHIRKVFKKTREELQALEKKKRGSREPPEDIVVIGENQRRRQENIFSEALSAKPRWTSALGRAQINEAEAKRPARIANSMRTRSAGVPQEESPKPENKPRKIRPKEEFYGSTNPVPEAILSKRSSARNSEQFGDPPRLATPLPDRWSQQNTSWQDDWKGSLVFPSEGKNKATVDKQDIERLDEGEFLNDNLLVFYLRKLEHDLQTENPDLAKRVYFQNPFFYERLTQNVPRGKKINYEAVQRWTAKVNLFEYDYIIVPVNENMHWYVAIICNVKKFLRQSSPEPAPPSPDLLYDDHLASKDGNHVDGTIASTIVSDKMEGMSLADGTPRTSKSKYFSRVLDEGARLDALAGPESKAKATVLSRDDTLSNREIEEVPISSDLVSAQGPEVTPAVSKAKQPKSKTSLARQANTDTPRIITLDSLGIPRSTTCTNLRHYLIEELKAKTGKDAEVPLKVGHTVKNIPQQDNYTDCGIFLLMYVEMFLQQGDEFIKDLIKGNQNLELKWPEAPELRSNIRQLLFDLQKEQVIRNETLREQKRKEKQLRLGTTRPKSDVKKSKPAPSSVTPEKPSRSYNKPTLNEPFTDNVNLDSRSPNVVSFVDRTGTAVTDRKSGEESGDVFVPDDRVVDQADLSSQPKSIAARMSDSFMNFFGRGATQGQNEQHHTIAEDPTLGHDAREEAECQEVPKNTNQEQQKLPSPSSPIEIPESPEVPAKKNVQKEYSNTRVQPALVLKADSLSLKQRLKESIPRDIVDVQNQFSGTPKTRASLLEQRSLPGRYPEGSLRNAIDLDEDDKGEGTVDMISVNHSAPTKTDDDDPMLLDDNKDSNIVSNYTHNQDPNPEANPLSLKTSSTVTPTTPPVTSVRSQRRIQHTPVSPTNVNANARGPRTPHPASKKRKATPEMREAKRSRQRTPSFTVVDSADRAIIGSRRPSASLDRPIPSSGYVVGRHTRFTMP